MQSIGKRIHGSLYLHADAIPQLPAHEQQRIADAASLLPGPTAWNVVKLEAARPHRLSLLTYEPFDDAAFPALLDSHAVDLDRRRVTQRSFRTSRNPPILHRKELLLPADHPRRAVYAELTAELERRGVMAEMAGMGFKQPWAARLAEGGIRIDDHAIETVAEPPTAHPPASPAPTIARHKTAIVRDRLSAPMQALYRFGLIADATSVLDYGCGQGDDVRTLTAAGITAVGWDPHHRPDNDALRPADIVNLGFVLNVIEEPAERADAISRAYALARGCLAVAVMVVGKGDVSGLTPYRDGYLTRRNTFQKYFEQDKLRRLLAATLASEPVAVAPGVFFVFKDELLEQRFLIARQARATVVARRTALPSTPSRPLSSRVRPPRTSLAERHAALIESYAAIMGELGRVPALDELPADLADAVQAVRIGQARLASLAAEQLGGETLATRQAERRDDLTVYFALNAFDRKRPYGSLPPELQRDIKAFFSNHQNTIDSGQRLLFAIADTDRLTADAEAAFNDEIGWLEDDDYYVHRDELGRLSPLLRTYVGVGQRLAGSLDDAQVFKIHLKSSKLTALDYTGFDDHPLPRLHQRVKIDLKRQRIDVFDYTRTKEAQVLYLKSRLLPKSHPDHERQTAFDADLLATSLFDFTGYGPPLVDFAQKLKRHNLTIDGHRLVRRE